MLQGKRNKDKLKKVELTKEELDDVDFDDDMVAFIFDSTGMMGSFTMEGTKFERIKP